MIEEEKWVDIEGYERVYQISSLGRIKCLDSTIKHSVRGYHRNTIKALRDCQPEHISLYGAHYPKVILLKDGKRVTHAVAELVAQAFLVKPEGASRLRRVDGDAWNVAASNLTYRTTKKSAVLSKPKDKRNGKVKEIDPFAEPFMSWVKTPIA